MVNVRVCGWEGIGDGSLEEGWEVVVDVWWYGEYSVEVDGGVAAADDCVALFVDEGEVTKMGEY